MAVDAQAARQELARRELARRDAAKPSPAAGQQDILGDSRMQELNDDPTLPLAGSKPIDTSATAGDRAQAGVSGINQGIAGLAGLPVDTALNVWDLGKAGIGALQGAITGGTPSDAFLPTDRSKVPLSTEFNSARLNDLGVETEAARPDDMASRLIHAGGTGIPGAVTGGAGGANAIRQGLAGVVSGLGGEAAGEFGADEGQQAVIANALGLAAGHKAASIPEKIPTAAVPNEGRDTLAGIRKQGIKVTPKEASQITGDKNYVGRALQAIGGDAKISKDMSATNRPVINEMGRKAVGSDSLTEKGLAPVKDAGNAVYTEMASLGNVAPTPELHAAIEKARGTAGKSTKRNTDIDKFVDSTLTEFQSGEIDAGQVVNRVRELRRDAANSRKGEGEKRPTVQQEALGDAQRTVADALDDFLEYNAATAGKPELADKYKENRVRLAKVGTVEGATRAGNLNAKQVFDAKDKGAPLTGKLNDIATANEYAPESTAPAGAETLMEAPGRNLSLTDLLLAVPQAAARHMGVNKFLQSDMYQNRIGGQAGGPHIAEHDTNPNALPPRPAPAPQPPASPQAAPDFAGELGLAPDAPYETLPGGVASPVNGRSLAEALGLQLAEDAPVNAGPARRAGPSDDLNFEAVTPEEVGPYRINTDMPLNDARPPIGVQRGASVGGAGDLELLPDAPQGPQDQLPPKPRRKPVQGGAPREPTPPKAPVAAPAPDAPPEGLSELGAMIDEMLRTKRPQQMENPAQQQQGSPDFAQALGVPAEPFQDRYMVPGSKRVSESPDEGYLAYEPKEGRRQINDAFVKEEARGKGLGQKNLVKAAKEAQDAGEPLDSDVSITPAQARAYISAQKKGLIEFDITDRKAWDDALAEGTNVKAGGQPVVKNIRPVTKQ